jgi:hypothetical protein
MDAHARRRARQKAIKADLAQAYSDEEASPPEWADLLDRVREGSRRIKDEIAEETARFVGEPDIKIALLRRDRVAKRIRDEIGVLNKAISRLNLIAPNARFTRPALRSAELLRPLYRSTRKAAESSQG